jgi:hypothetical protein
MRDMKNVYKIFIGKPEGMMSLAGPCLRWEDNIKVDLTEIRWESVVWICLLTKTR